MIIRRQGCATSGTLLTALLICTAYTKGQTPSPTLITLYNFAGGSEGSLPNGVVIGTGGVLYGTTEQGGTGTAASCNVFDTSGCGTVFSLTPPASPGGPWTESVLHSFSGSDGFHPEAVVIGNNGTLYGTTSSGGTGPAGNGFGTVFSLTPPASPGGSWTEAVLHRFTGGADGGAPFAGVVVDSGGVLYGTTVEGGTGSACNLSMGVSNCGTVFSLTPPASPGGSWTETVLYNFAGGSDGNSPWGPVVIGTGGVLYGTTPFGGGVCGGLGCGTVFSLTAPTSPGGSWTKAVLHRFTGGSDGAIPYAGLVIGSGGALYGTTYQGGTGPAPCSIPAAAIPGCGIVFSLTPPASPGGSWTEAVLHSFNGGSDGALPIAGLALGSGGVLYGTTTTGGTGSCSGFGAGCGIVFSLTPPPSPGGAWTETVLHDFTGTSDGSVAANEAGVVIDTAGALYGSTQGGNLGFGTVFSLTEATGLSPSINPGGVVSAASFVAPVAPGSIASAFGDFLLSSPLGTQQSPLPTSISGLSLEFVGGTPAPLFFVSGLQVNLQVPWELATQSQASLTATLNGQTSGAQTVDLAPFAPAIFSTNAKGSGQGAILDPSYHLVDSSNPATDGSVVLIYCTGLGAVTNQPPTGSPASNTSLSYTTTTPIVKIGGVSANLLFSGLAPGYVGLYQVNAQVPAGLAANSAVPVVISIGGGNSNTVTIAIQ